MAFNECHDEYYSSSANELDLNKQLTYDFHSNIILCEFSLVMYKVYE